MRYLLPIAFVATILFSACRSTADGTLVARINGQPISAEDFRGRFHEYQFGKDASLASPAEMLALKKRVLSELIEEKALLEEANRRNISVTPEELERALSQTERDYPEGALPEILKQMKMSLSRWRDRTRQKILLDKIIAEVTKDVPSPRKEEIEQYYKEHIDEFKTPEQFRIQQIVVKTKEDGERILTEIKKGVLFDELARNHSYTPEAQQGGHLGWMNKGVMPAKIDEILPKLAIGKVSPIVETEYGFHVLKVLEKRPANQETLEEATPTIVRKLTQNDREEKFSRWRQEILSKAKIERNHAILENIN